MIKKNLIYLVAAARPNFMKIAPVYHALKQESWCDVNVIHTGQHYDANMSDAFFQDLEMPSPDVHLDVGSGTHAEQTAAVMVAFEKACLEARPDWVIVVGDVNSTVACALVAAKLCIPVAHLEAGLRSGDRTMPEEINRIVTDAIADLLWTPSPDGDENLKREGVPSEKIERIGNVMIDSYELLRDKIQRDTTRELFNLVCKDYGVVTLHRPANVDDRENLSLLAYQIVEVAKTIKLVFAVHPRTRSRLKAFGLEDRLEEEPGLIMTEPLSYIKFMNLVEGCRIVITDSGGIQEETTYLGIPCLTVRDTTERPITITEGTNQLVRPEVLIENVTGILGENPGNGRRPALWDGQAASRLVSSLKRKLITQ